MRCRRRGQYVRAAPAHQADCVSGREARARRTTAGVGKRYIIDSAQRRAGVYVL